MNAIFLDKQVSNYLSPSQKVNWKICTELIMKIALYLHRFLVLINVNEDSPPESQLRQKNQSRND